MGEILVVRVPGELAPRLEELRQYVRESVSQGVLVLAEGMQMEVLSLPELGADTSPKGEEEPSAAPTGRGAEEKRAIQERLKAYRRAHGLGCFRVVAQAGEPEVTETMLRGMVSGTASYPLSSWRAAGRALDRAEQQKGEEVTP